MFWIGVLHILLPLMIIAYVIFSPAWLDPYAFLYVLILTLHWIAFRGECLISYLYKVWKDPSYKMGQDVSLKDIEDILRYIHSYYGVSYQTTRILLDVLNYGAILILLVRFLILKTIPSLFVWIYVVLATIWIILLKAGQKYKLYDILMSLVFLFLVFYVVYKLTFKTTATKD